MSVSILCDRVSAGMSRTVAIENARRSSSKRKRETRHFMRLSLNFEYYHTTKRLILSQFCLAKRLAITPRHALLRSDPAWDRWTAPGHPVSGPQRRCSGRTDLDGATEIGWRAGSQAKRWAAHQSPLRKAARANRDRLREGISICPNWSLWKFPKDWPSRRQTRVMYPQLNGPPVSVALSVHEQKTTGHSCR